eukprot:NODE_3831_length_1977_cov_14.283784.p1 GENE.NODE_3831_length_1977_cov_14.283784~~NODE_3831_length_1977_cov_14.283784.p1  ORF type:complete len:533 (+),score=158.92 NODE_3831_length_1977_cov_14.283784:94-1692(+)
MRVCGAALLPHPSTIVPSLFHHHVPAAMLLRRYLGPHHGVAVWRRAASSRNDAVAKGGNAELEAVGEAEGAGEVPGGGPQRASGTGLHTGPEPSASQIVEAIAPADAESFPRFQKPFVGFLWVLAKAGNGGEPALYATRRMNFRGAGFGGHGGNVYLKATQAIESFVDVPQKVRAQNGGDGHDTRRGMHAKDFALQVPVGTIVRERVYTGEKSAKGRRIYLPQFRYQFLRTGDTYVVARGGIGGVGPRSFKKGDGRPGTPGEKTRLELELRLINDCALLGIPNAGKTSLLAAMSRAHTRIGPEAFSTTRPHVGVISFRDRVRIRVMDLPGIESGAHADKEMGMRILRHTYRSRALCIVVNVARGTAPSHDVLEEVEMLRREAILHDGRNADKPWMVVGTKCDMLHRDALFHLDSLYYRLRARYGAEVPVVGTSARFGLGLTRLVQTIRDLLFPTALDVLRRTPAQHSLRGLPRVLHEGFKQFPGRLPSTLPGAKPLPLLPAQDEAAHAETPDAATLDEVKLLESPQRRIPES